MFISENKNNIAIWYSSTNSVSALNLFTLWKGRRQKAWNSVFAENKKRRPIESMVKQIRFTKDGYEVQAMNILRNMSIHFIWSNKARNKLKNNKNNDPACSMGVPPDADILPLPHRKNHELGRIIISARKR
ncbi:hypothetical protein BDF21DRAFT_62576 [Thamnidium elegans]|nr:hypothetical protein BDF21DRAFT_62576 [Thamnidium elegans]